MGLGVRILCRAIPVKSRGSRLRKRRTTNNEQRTTKEEIPEKYQVKR